MKTYLTNLKKQAEENPLTALAVGAAVVTVVTKFMQANNERKNASTWEKEVERRRMKKA